MGRIKGLGLLLFICAACNERTPVHATYGFPVAFPDRHEFGAVALHAGATTKVKVTNAGRADVTVTALELEGVGRRDFVVEDAVPSLAVGEERTLRVSFKPTATGLREATIRLKTDSVDRPELVVRLAGFGVDARALLSAEVLDFGKVELQSTRTLALQMENPSQLPVRIGWELVGGDADQFTVSGPDWLEGHGVGALQVSFTPSRENDKLAGIKFVPCHGCDPVAVLLKGKGIASALRVDPETLNFGAVAVDQQVERELTVENVSDLAVELRTVVLQQGTDGSFSLQPGAVPRTLQPGERHVAIARFGPTHLGEATGGVVLGSSSAYRPEIRVPMLGDGGGAEISVTPEIVEFGERPNGSNTRQYVRVRNMGGANAADLVVTGVELDGDPAFSAVLPATPRRLKVGEFVDVPVHFEPTSARGYNGRLLIRSSDGARPVVNVTLLGRGREHQPCQVRVTPRVIDFGSVQPDRGIALGFKVENVGSDLCAVKNLRVVDDAGGAFWLNGDVPPGYELKPNRSFVRWLSFRAKTPGSYAGRLRLEVSNPFAPVVEVPLRANVESLCLVANPRYVDWGAVRNSCPPELRTVEYVNVCTTPVVVDDVYVGEGTGLDYAVTRKPFLPLTLQPGETFSVDVRYLAQIEGANLVPLYVATPSAREPVTVPLIGHAYFDRKVRDRFTQQASNRIDVLFVVDNSESMVEEQPRLRDAIPDFLAAAKGAGMDMQVGVTTTGLRSVPGGNCPGGVRGGEAGRLFPVDRSRPRIVSPNMSNAVSVLQENTQVGYCHHYEQAFEAMKLALSSPLVSVADDVRTPEPMDGNLGFYRDEAALAVVFVSDEDDHSGADVKNYVDFLRNLKGANQPQRVSVYAIAPTAAQGCSTAGGVGTRYAELAAQMGGEVLDICAPDFRPALLQVANKAFGPQDAFPLTETPMAGTLEVWIDGRQATSGWRYDAGTNAIVFDRSSRPAAGAKIHVEYEAECD
ncbi:MAG: choice-of-anchor D domain-containing protein [Myxococcales bacterium]